VKAKRSLTLLFVLGSLAALGSPAGADSVAKFYQGPNGGAGYTGPFNGGTTVYGLTQALSTNCPSLGSCTTDNIQSSLVFTALGITASATNVWGDFSPNFGGLGVGTGSTASGVAGDDQINIGEILRIHFNTTVTLTGVGTLFDPNHAPFGPGFSSNETTLGAKDFLFCSTGPACNPTTEVSFSSANNRGLSFTGTDFAFTESSNASTGQVEFYVSGLSYNPVPGPFAGAGLPGLIAACGGLLALSRRRRTSAAAA